LIRLGVRKLVEEVLEAGVEDRLVRGYYGRGEEVPVVTEMATAGGGSRALRGPSITACLR
jgi:hypothetical protein